MARERTDDEYDDDGGDDRGRDRPRRRGGDPALGRELVRGPGTALLVFGLFSVLLALGMLGLYVASPDTIIKPLHDAMLGMVKDMPKQPGQPDPVPPYDEYKKTAVPQGIGGSAISLVSSAVIAFAGLRLRQARSKGLAMTGSILAMIPCTSSCCLIGLPIGIWAIVTLGKPDVKAAFAANSRPQTFDDLDDRG